MENKIIENEALVEDCSSINVEKFGFVLVKTDGKGFQQYRKQTEISDMSLILTVYGKLFDLKIEDESNFQDIRPIHVFRRYECTNQKDFDFLITKGFVSSCFEMKKENV